MIIRGFIDSSFSPPAPAVKAFISIEKLNVKGYSKFLLDTGASTTAMLDRDRELLARMAQVEGVKLTIVPKDGEEGGCSAQCLGLPGCISGGETREEASADIREEGYLEAFPEELGQPKQKKGTGRNNCLKNFQQFLGEKGTGEDLRVDFRE